MKIISTLNALLIAITLIGCSNTAPKCSDQETLDTIVQIARGEIEKQAGKETASKVKIELTAIRTTDTNEKIGSFACASEINVIVDGISNKTPITYTVELIDDGEQFYVNVFGL